MNQLRPDEPERPSHRPTPAARNLSGIEAASLVKFAYFTDEPPAVGTLLYTAFRRNMPPGVKEFTVGKSVTFFYGIQQTGGLLAIQVRWINPDGVVVRTSDQPMDQSKIGALWTWQVDTLDRRDLSSAGVWAVELLISAHRVGRYPLLVRTSAR
ncbi:MAG TPA: hypothetical protein VEH80_00450 [Candidatus Bathyarchaeia archaeon]|nr:hypothetical protein [Candidatus Bathyarchaeia archaeon]